MLKLYIDLHSNIEENVSLRPVLGGEAIKDHRRNEDFISYKIEWREQMFSPFSFIMTNFVNSYFKAIWTIQRI